MKQVLIRGGDVVVDEVPAPGFGPRELLVRVEHSCVSVGTELTSVELSGLPLYRRALKQPDHARRVLEVARDEGFVRTYKRVRGLLDAGVATGYSAAGRVVSVGDDVQGFAAGDRVACAGAGVANHAEAIRVPVNLAARIPDGLDTRAAATVTLGAIALHGIRRTEVALGETVGVLGLGILGQLTVQMLTAAGCRVVGSDPDPDRVRRALAAGMNIGVGSGREFSEAARGATDGFGADAVLITAATPSDDVVHQAFDACRKRGRVVLVGDVGLGLRRSDMYEKELELRISTSYGPGRYDERYELEGHDYPIGYVRWTETRNMEEYLRLLAAGKVSLDGLGVETFSIDDAPDAYSALRRESDRPLVVLLSYPERDGELRRTIPMRTVSPTTGRISVALVGAGTFAQSVHVPNLLKLRDRFALRWVASRTASTAKAVAERAEATFATTDVEDVLADDDVDLVLIATRNDLHADLALRSLEAGKHVFVEKPLALTEDELARIEAFYANREGPLLMTGFNRRFSPAAQRMRELVAAHRAPLMATYRMNAGYLPPEHWVHGPSGGGRNIGEACHVYDLFDFLTQSAVEDVDARAIRPPDRRFLANDNFAATVAYEDGSVCTLVYTALGHRRHPKERMEVFAEGSVLSLDDYRVLTVSGRGSGWRSRTRQKGHVEELEALAACLRSGGPWPISLEEQLRAMRISFRVEERLLQWSQPND